MSGKGGGQRGPVQQAQPDPELQAFTREVREESGPLREEVFRQAFEALRTGGISARLPIIQRAVETSRGATARALTETETSLRGAGLAGTPFAETELSRIRQAGELATETIPTQIAQEFISVTPQLALGSAGQIFGALVGGAQEAGQRAIAGARFGTQERLGQLALFGDIFRALSGLGFATGGALAGRT